MSNLMPIGGLGAEPLSRLESKLTNRALSYIRHNATVGVARIEATVELQALKAEGLGYVGKQALQQVALLSQLEHQLATIVPMAASRLQGIGDMVALSLAEVVADTTRQLR